MTIEANPPRELNSDRVVRLAVGRQLVRVTLLCALSLMVGIGVGQYFVRQQFQIQQGLVAQLQNEIRGLTSDIQRLELSSSQSIARFENAVHRLETAQRVERLEDLQQSEQRLSTLERLIQRQLAGLEAAQAGCLAEFEPYRRKQLAVPVEIIDAAIARLAAGRVADLHLLSAEIEAHSELERVRIATLDRTWALSRAGRSSPQTSLSAPLPSFPYDASRTTNTAGVASEAAAIDSPPAESTAIPPAIAAPFQDSPADLAWTPEDDHPLVESDSIPVVAEGNESLEPIPDDRIPTARSGSPADR